MSVSAGGIDLEAIGKIITDKKICHRRHRPPHAAGRAARRRSPTHIRARAQIYSGRAAGDLVRLRHGPRGHEPPPAFYKTVALVLGTNIVRKELGLPEAEVLAADPRYSLVVPAK